MSAAILAIGYPVALDARAEERETRGLTSMTRYSPVDCSTANCTLHPPLMFSLLISLRAASRSI